MEPETNKHNHSLASAPQSSSPPWRVLVFPGGTEIGLEIRHALARCKEVELFSASAPVSNHAPFVFANHFHLPVVAHSEWLEALQEVVESKRITHIFPAHDDALLALIRHADQISAKVVTSPLETCELTRSKSATLRRLETVVPTPQLFANVAAVTGFPVCIKPDRGQGARRTDCATDLAALKASLRADPDRIIVEFLPGREFTVDCFSDREHGLLYTGGRERRRIRHGIAMDTSFVADERFHDYAVRINAALTLHGAWFFQVKEDSKDTLKLLEVAPRIGGTSCLSRVCGVNLPLLSLYESEHIHVRIEPAHHTVRLDRALVNRFQHNIAYRTLYVDFDDTLVLRGSVNADLVRLLYQALNKGRRLVLLTRHEGDVEARLRHFRLSALFDEIVQLRAWESKASYVLERDAVFIDDSYAERLEVFRQTGVPVFDPSMIELLLDDRT